MTKLRSLILLSSASILATSSVYAAGIVDEKYKPAPIEKIEQVKPSTPLNTVPVFPLQTTDNDKSQLWSRGYVGIGAGWALGTQKLDFDDASISKAEFDHDGYTFSVLGGYERQFNNHWVVGFEADLGYTSKKGDITRIPVSVTDNPETPETPETPEEPEWEEPGPEEIILESVKASTTSLSDKAASSKDQTSKKTTSHMYNGRLRGRLGYLVNDETMVFGAAGLAAAYDDDFATGITVGTGLDYKISNNVSLRAEYLYDRYMFDNIKHIDSNAGEHSLRAAVTYNFGN